MKALEEDRRVIGLCDCFSPHEVGIHYRHINEVLLCAKPEKFAEVSLNIDGGDLQSDEGKRHSSIAPTCAKFYNPRSGCDIQRLQEKANRGQVTACGRATGSVVGKVVLLYQS